MNKRFPSNPPEDALDWFRAKGYKPSFHYSDVWKQEHSQAFTVAKAMKMDVLTTIRESLDKALEQGKTYEQFKNELTPELQKLGWWGEGQLQDPYDKSGKSRRVQLGSPRRLKTIYNTNMRTARAAGQWERIERRQKTHPYLVYELGPSENHRVQHVKWAGLVLRADDPFWATHYPQNGWGCKCGVRQINKREADKLKATSDYTDQAPEIEYKEWVNKRTGEVHKVPKGIDPGWDYNPGVTRGTAINEHAKTAKKEMQTVLAKPVPERYGSIIQAPEAERIAAFKAWKQQPTDKYPLVQLPDDDIQQLQALQAVASMSSTTLAKQLNKHPELTDQEYANAQQVIDNASEKIKQGNHLLYVDDETTEQGGGYVLVVKVTASKKGTWVTSYRRLSSDQAKKDKELIRLRAKQK